MAKQLTWSISEPELDNETGEATGNTVEHAVALRYSYLTGKAVVTIDGDDFDISTKPLSLKGTNQMFRLGELAALLVFPKKGDPDIVIDNVCIRSGLPYSS